MPLPQNKPTLHIALDERGAYRISPRGSPVQPGAVRSALDVNDTTLWSDEASDVLCEADDPSELASGSTGILQLRFAQAQVDWTLSIELSEDARTATVSSSITNTGDDAIKLGRCRLFVSDVTLGPDPQSAVFLACSGTTQPSRVRRIASGDGLHASKTIAQLFDADTSSALHAGFVTLDRMNTEHEISLSGDGSRIKLVSFCDFAGFQLPPGESVETERLLLIVDSDPQACLEAWADRVAEAYSPRIRPRIPSGWVGWAWVDPFNVEPYESVVLRNAKALRRRLPGFDIEYIWVSIGNLKDGLPGNWLEWNDELFPNGVAQLVDELGRLDLKLGFWMGSFWMCTALEDRINELRDALLMKDGEPMVVRPEWQYGAAGRLPKDERPGMLALDPTHPTTHRLLREVLGTYYEWGVRYYMIDFLHAVSGSTPGDFIPDGYSDASRIPGPDTYRAGLQVVREAAGEDTYLLSSTGPTYQNVGLVDACRVGNDYGEGRALNPESYFYPATYVINSAGFWTSHRAATDALAAGYCTHRKLYLADSGNVLTVDKPIALSDALISATIFGINGGPMMLGDDIDRMSDERLALIRKCLPRLPECARPLDLFHSPEPDYVKLFHLKISREWDEWHILAAFNYTDEELVQPIDPRHLGLDPSAELVIWDFWNEQYEGVRCGEFDLRVPPSSVKVVRLAERRDHPWLLSTDMHIRQGQAEIDDCRWDADAMTLRICAARPAGETGNAFIHVPPGLSITDPDGLWIAKDGNDDSLIARAAFHFDDRPAERRITFAPITDGH